MVNPAIHRLPNAEPKPNRQYVTARRPTYVTDGIPTLHRVLRRASRHAPRHIVSQLTGERALGP